MIKDSELISDSLKQIIKEATQKFKDEELDLDENDKTDKLIPTKKEKINHYKLGDGEITLTKHHVLSAIKIMKLTSILFFGIITVPIILILSSIGWWLYA